MKTTIYFFFTSVLFSFSSFAQHDFDTEGILYSNAAGTAVAIGTIPQGSYGSNDKALEIYSPSATIFNLKSGTNSMFLVNNPIYGNYLSAPTNLPFKMNVAGNPNQFVLQTNGNVTIGTTLNPTDFKLAVGGKIIAEELKVQLQSAPWPDYVFTNEYQLPSLQEVEKQIREKGHLENIPSACEVQENGLEVGEMNRLLLEKVEELTLYTIDQQKQLDKQTKEMEALKALVNKLVQKNK